MQQRGNRSRPNLPPAPSTNVKRGSKPKRPSAAPWTSEYIENGAIRRISVAPNAVKLTRCGKCVSSACGEYLQPS